MPSRVLFVDDDAPLVETATAALERTSDLDVVGVTSGAAALDAVEEESFDCVVVDYAMPGMDGLELLDRLRERGVEAPFILFSGEVSPDLVSDVLDADVDDFVRKGDEAEEFAVLASRIEDAIARSQTEQVIGDVLDALPDMVFVLDRNVELVRWNRALEEVTGYDTAEIEAMNALDLIAPEDREEIATSVVERFEEGGEGRGRARVLTADGERVPTEFHSTRVRTPQGDRIVGVSRDIAARLEAERRLRENERRLSELTGSTSDVLWMFDADFEELLFVNDAYEDVYGLSRDALESDPMDFLNAVHPDDRERVREELAQLGDGEPIDLEYRVDPHTEYGTWVWVEGQPLYEDGEVARVAGFSRDVTERRRREHELERQNQHLEKFASIVSHDLRNPLTVIDGSLELARETGEAEHFERAERAVDRMEQLITDLLTLAREGRTVESRESTSIRAVAERAWDACATDDATLEVAGDLVVDADADRLRQVFENLFTNAVRHGPEDVTVTVGPLATETGFYVADDGPGIPPDRRERAFEPGYTTREGGTGFGLNIVQGIVEAHGWSVSATESEDGGARFEVRGVHPVDQSGKSSTGSTE